MRQATLLRQIDLTIAFQAEGKEGDDDNREESETHKGLAEETDNKELHTL